VFVLRPSGAAGAHGRCGSEAASPVGSRPDVADKRSPSARQQPCRVRPRQALRTPRLANDLGYFSLRTRSKYGSNTLTFSSTG